ncbi:MAG: acireductone synthase [Cyanobacteria bacterium]|nr:acireductone synthase [Cyanobacteriota bacterium]
MPNDISTSDITQWILLDIEGTTTEIAFVHQVLFPYARDRMDAYIQDHWQEEVVLTALSQVKATLIEEGLNHPIDAPSELSQILVRWIDEDRKHTALKTIQGFIWRQGYETGAYQSHIYPDVPKALAHWKETGKQLAIYSSGSVEAQKLLFQYSIAGDLTPYFSDYFDTRVGAKQESESYILIARHLGCSPGAILFLSDHPKEISAARNAGCQASQIVRKSTEEVGSQSVNYFQTLESSAFSHFLEPQLLNA